MKILYITTISSTMDFFPEHFKMLISEGNTIELACNCEKPVSKNIAEMGFKTHNIPFSRSPLSKDNISAYFRLKKVIAEGNYDIVHCHTPIASAITRLVCRKFRKKGLKVFYTAHGFHFFKGAPTKNWLIYYPVEWLCAHWTDVLITINKEDYALAQKKMKARKVYYIPGIGVNTKRFKNCSKSKEEKRKELSIPDNAFVMLSVGELSSRKNHKVIINALGRIKDKNIFYLIAGSGRDRQLYLDLIDQYGLKENIFLLGSRSDVDELCTAADVFVHPSAREGLGLSPLEGMAAGLPLISSFINGIKDYTQNDVTGCCVNDPFSVEAFEAAIVKMRDDRAFREKCSANNVEIADRFDFENSVNAMKKIYTDN